MTTLTLQVAQVKLGNLEIEGLLDTTDGTFYIAQQQLATMFKIIPTSAPKWLKSLLVNDDELFSAFTNRHDGRKQHRAEKVTSLKGFEIVLRKLDRQGNKLAQELVDNLVGLSLTQLFSDAFGIKFEEEDRQKYLIARQESKDLFFELGGAISEWFEETKADRSQPKERYFSNSFDAINLGLFGKRSKQIKAELGVSSGALIRDNFSNDALSRITQIQRIAANQMRKNKGMKPKDAINLALTCSLLDKIHYGND